MKTESGDAAYYIRNLIKSGENQKLDFKFEISDAKKIARTFSSFANTYGGKLLIGVKDNGRIRGIQTDEEAYMAESAAQLFCKPAVIFHLKKFFVEGKTILEVEIPLSENRPHYAKNETGQWVAYVRINDKNIQANRILVNVWKNEGQKGIFLSYGKAEKMLLDYLTGNEKISLSKFLKMARINRAEGEKILVDLILMNVIELELTEKTMYFRPKSGNTDCIIKR